MLDGTVLLTYKKNFESAGDFNCTIKPTIILQLVKC